MNVSFRSSRIAEIQDARGRQTVDKFQKVVVVVWRKQHQGGDAMVISHVMNGAGGYIGVCGGRWAVSRLGTEEERLVYVCVSVCVCMCVFLYA